MSEPYRTALVTGGSRGIGAAITRQLAERGVRVACTYRTGRPEAAALAAEYGDSVLPVQYDLAQPNSARDVISTVLERWGRLDSLVLNAGVWRGGRLGTIDHGDWWSVLESNVGGTARLSREALPALQASDGGSVVLISSAVGLVGFAGDTAYAAAKSAMIGFARSLAKETGRDGIRVNVLAPGFVETDMTAAVGDRARRRITDDLILRRFGEPGEIAKAAVFLSEDATYCTGIVLTADGGWSL
ncbi:SDR family NAD(P)-dependent oxidoreductase [Qaidamihabitans albus]|uniref:SDR family NAD(P)-dependent oxidoreductase n=1 Tax=Qaidamihabitans albus TaxID=2795733 RepID=UPI0027DE27D7|nr:SDR family oxidoreductase [Qaidamihabitans albus]